MNDTGRDLFRKIEHKIDFLAAILIGFCGLIFGYFVLRIGKQYGGIWEDWFTPVAGGLGVPILVAYLWLKFDKH